MSCGVGHTHRSNLLLLSLHCRLAALAPIQPLAWELPCAASVTLKRKKEKKKKEKVCRGHYRQFTKEAYVTIKPESFLSPQLSKVPD